MSLYLLGNLAGRLVLCYVLVWLVMWLISPRDWRAAFRRMHRWYGFTAVAVLFVVGLAASSASGRFS